MKTSAPSEDSCQRQPLTPPMSSSSAKKELYYTTHHNWAWVVEAALDEVAADLGSAKIVHCSRVRDLPSARDAPRRKPEYALVRVEYNGSAFSATSNAFAAVDDKDALFQALQDGGAKDLMPETALLRWDADCEGDVPDSPKLEPSCLLKAACGSAGFGLYFVYSKADILEVIRFHASKARAEPGFIDKLARDHGKVPMWSLQSVVPSFRIDGGRRCQIRAYVVYCNSHLYLYEDYEVRVPSWGKNDIDNIISSSGSRNEDAAGCEGSSDGLELFDEACCNSSSARPYNRGRNKQETRRHLLDEFETLKGAKANITACLLSALSAMRRKLDGCARVDDPSRTNVAVAGVDLMLAAGLLENGVSLSEHAEAKILEFNNNPAMPSSHKSMSPDYRTSLVRLVRSIILLGLSGGVNHDKFMCCW
jgi:hypothetical protein